MRGDLRSARAATIGVAVCTLLSCAEEGAIPPGASGDDTASSSSPTATPLGDDAWAPPVYRDRELSVMPVTFPDGTTAEITYPHELALDDMGVSLEVTADGPD